MTKKVSRHHEGAHKYKRRWIGKAKDYEVYACVLPNCRHYIAPEHLEGKEYVCWRCGNTVVATVNTRSLAKPHCKNCTKTKSGKPAVKSNFKSEGHLPEIDLSDLI
jgi:hypothetical protein